MKTTLFVTPIKAGKLQAAKTFLNTCIGPKKQEYKDLLLRYDLNNVKIWFQALKGTDYMMFSHDMGEKGMEKLAIWENSTHPFDQWFKQQLESWFDLGNEPKQPAFFAALDAKK